MTQQLCHADSPLETSSARPMANCVASISILTRVSRRRPAAGLVGPDAEGGIRVFGVRRRRRLRRCPPRWPHSAAGALNVFGELSPQFGNGLAIAHGLPPEGTIFKI